MDKGRSSSTHYCSHYEGYGSYGTDAERKQIWSGAEWNGPDRRGVKSQPKRARQHRGQDHRGLGGETLGGVDGVGTRGVKCTERLGALAWPGALHLFGSFFFFFFSFLLSFSPFSFPCRGSCLRSFVTHRTGQKRVEREQGDRWVRNSGAGSSFKDAAQVCWETHLSRRFFRFLLLYCNSVGMKGSWALTGFRMPGGPVCLQLLAPVRHKTQNKVGYNWTYSNKSNCRKTTMIFFFFFFSNRSKTTQLLKRYMPHYYTVKNRSAAVQKLCSWGIWRMSLCCLQP